MEKKIVEEFEYNGASIKIYAVLIKDDDEWYQDYFYMINHPLGKIDGDGLFCTLKITEETAKKIVDCLNKLCKNEKNLMFILK